MSKIGEKEIEIPETTQLKIEKYLIIIKGKQGQLSIVIPKGIEVVKGVNSVLVKRKSDDKKTVSLHGLIKTLIQNAVTGVEKLWEKRLKIVGTGYRVRIQGTDLVLELGYSHPIIFNKTEGISLTTEGTNKIIIKGVDKQLVGQIAYQIKSIKKPDPYKGKGIQYEGEKIKFKPGKKEKATATK